MNSLATEAVRALPASPLTFGLVTFGIFAFLAFVVLRLDRDR
jgi:hypothetical protein